ncbi:aspartyl-phosphate phosphatase Spo0E family protein [[Clostridium] dakarense]|uniref:aspartyl-phosphate phosphatase Spo0E family protein n=1 Tax=Faecalimicrobium dakarense TaxID=1301100 RepID=UPI0004B8D539|nr:aspartyl-phosphate phosphatase Spo0E family protein [[Clostridium] dakarense]
MELKDIIDKRIDKKLKLHEAIDKYGIKSSEVLKLSRELDVLITKEMKLKN